MCRNNIRYAKLDSSDTEIVLAAQFAQIHDKIMKLPQKYDTMVSTYFINLHKLILRQIKHYVLSTYISRWVSEG